jgi:hypothetical protein
MALLFAACNSDEIPKETASDSQDSRDTDTDSNSNSNSNTDSNSNSNSNSATESNSDTVPTGGDTDSDSADTSASTPSTPSDPSESESDTIPTDPANTESNTITDSDPTDGTATDSDTDTESGGNVCAAPEMVPGNECETCLYDNCNAEYCACAAGDMKCMCVVNCLEGVTNSGDENGLDDLLGVDVDDLAGGLLDILLGNLLDDLGQGDFDELGDVLECLSAAPCGIPLDSLGGLSLDLDDLDNLEDILNGDNVDEFLEDLLETAGNSLSPLLTCSALTNPGGECGTVCPLQGSLLE